MAFDRRKSLALWRRREKYRKARHTKHDRAGRRRAAAKWKKLLLEARAMVARRERQGNPSVRLAFNPRVSGYGSLGPIQHVTIHHDAAEITKEQATPEFVAARLRAYDAQHQASYGGGIGYHEAIDPWGRIWKLRSAGAKGAHTRLHNSNNYGIMLLGNFEIHRPTTTQVTALRNRLEVAPDGLPSLRGVPLRGHRDWPDNATACPGRYIVIRDGEVYTP